MLRKMGATEVIVAGLLLGVMGLQPAAAGELQLGSPASGAVLPRPEASEHNPAFAFLPPISDIPLGRRLPVGPAGLLMPRRNPLLYWSDPETFRREFDFLSFYDQLYSPLEFLIHPSRSPEEVRFVIDGEQLRLETDGGESMRYGSTPGTAGIALPRSALIPPPLLSYSLRRGRWYSRTGLFFSSSGYRIAPDKNLRAVLGGEPLEPDSRYEAEAQVALDSGLSSSISYALRLPTEVPRYNFSLVPRLTGYYRLAYAELDYRLSTLTGESALPGSFRSEASALYLYPGEGWGGGGRFDLGTAVTAPPWRFGVSLLNIYGLDLLEGRRLDVQNLEPEGGAATERLVNAGSDPLLFASAAIEGRAGRLKLVAGVNGGVHREYLLANALLRLRWGRWVGELKGGRQGVWTFGGTLGRIFSFGTAAVSMHLHSSPLTEQAPWGIGLRFGSRGGRP